MEPAGHGIKRNPGPMACDRPQCRIQPVANSGDAEPGPAVAPPLLETQRDSWPFLMSVLVTGAAGFIGSHVAERLLVQGQEVVGLDLFDDFYDPVIKQANLA